MTEPTQADIAAADYQNELNVKELAEDSYANWEAGGYAVLLGDGHSCADVVRQQADYAYGTFAVKRATFGAGSLAFSGAGTAHQDLITAAVGRFSAKAVQFE